MLDHPVDKWKEEESPSEGGFIPALVSSDHVEWGLKPSSVR